MNRCCVGGPRATFQEIIAERIREQPKKYSD